jgi:putative acetyltransferase
MRIRRAIEADQPTMLDIWLRSVRATHSFLTEADIQTLLPLVRDVALLQLEVWVLSSDNDQVVGFIGLSEANVEALFIAPEWSRRGGGRALLQHAQELRGLLAVDVNEQNPEALRFYQAHGFVVVGRSDMDRGGRPFPLIHLRQVAK